VIALASGLAAGERSATLAGTALAAALGVAALRVGARGGPARRRVAYRLLLAGMVALALGWVVAIRP
jgi:hypothetical protein